MNTRSIQTRRVDNYQAMTQEGDFYWDRGTVQHPDAGAAEYERIHLWLPNDNPGDPNIVIVCLAVRRGPNVSPRVWGWDGNADKPTLTPSIDCKSHWHGYLQAGELKSC